MKKRILLFPAVMLLVAGQSLAQSAEEERALVESEQRQHQVLEAREVEYQERLAEAEARMAEAARQIAELTGERLPEIHRIEERIRMMIDGRPRLGVTISPEDDEGPVEGVRVVGVTPGSAGSEAGLRSGDILTAVNDENLSAASAAEANRRLLDFMAGVEAGDVVTVEYLRDGKVGQVEVEPKAADIRMFGFSGAPMRAPGVPGLQAIPEIAGDLRNRFVLNWTAAGWGDMELVELNEGLGRYFGTDEGLLVVRAPQSAILELEDGDVIQEIDGRKPTSVRHGMRILGSYEPGEQLTLKIMRDRKRRTLEVEIPEDLSTGLHRSHPPGVAPARAPVPRRPVPPPERS